MPEPRQSCGGAEFSGPRGLGASDLHSFPVVVLRLGRRLAAHDKQGVAPGDEQRALEVALACPAGNGERLVGDGDRLVPAAVANEGLRKQQEVPGLPQPRSGAAPDRDAVADLPDPESAVEPTRSQNMIVSCRRSATEGARGGCTAIEGGSPQATVPSSRIALRSFSR